jgi:TetR/AcrR family transcriptional regulator, cholesterol catabolism regulator
VPAKTKPARRYRQFTERKLEILRSASTAFAKNGFSGATMEDIAEKVNMAKGNLYYYFPSKQDLLFFIQDQSLGRLIEQAELVSRSAMSATEKLRALISAHVKTILQEIYGSTAHTDFRSLPPAQLKKVIRKRDRYEKSYRQVIELGIADGTFRKCNVKTTTWAILGALNWTVQWFSPDGSISVDELGSEYADFFLHALSA